MTSRHAINRPILTLLFHEQPMREIEPGWSCYALNQSSPRPKPPRTLDKVSRIDNGNLHYTDDPIGQGVYQKGTTPAREKLGLTLQFSWLLFR
jgi:hypothetical protein